jgi:hypothetical protein
VPGDEAELVPRKEPRPGDDHQPEEQVQDQPVDPHERGRKEAQSPAHDRDRTAQGRGPLRETAALDVQPAHVVLIMRVGFYKAACPDRELANEIVEVLAGTDG